MIEAIHYENRRTSRTQYSLCNIPDEIITSRRSIGHYRWYISSISLVNMYFINFIIYDYYILDYNMYKMFPKCIHFYSDLFICILKLAIAIILSRRIDIPTCTPYSVHCTSALRHIRQSRGIRCRERYGILLFTSRDTVYHTYI